MSTISLWVQLVLSIPFLACIISNAFIIKNGKRNRVEQEGFKKRNKMTPVADPMAGMFMTMLLLVLVITAPLFAAAIAFTGWSTKVTDNTIR